jgi:hypothetical protein
MHAFAHGKGNGVATRAAHARSDTQPASLLTLATRRRPAARFGVASVHLRKNCANYSGVFDPAS